MYTPLLQFSSTIDDLTPTKENVLNVISSLEEELDYVVLFDYKTLVDQFYATDRFTARESPFVEDSRVLLEFLWEQLHSGHWKNIPSCWRILYASVRLLRALHRLKVKDHIYESVLRDSLTELDYGLLLGEPIFDGLLCEIATLIQGILTEQFSKKRESADALLWHDSDLPSLNSLGPLNQHPTFIPLERIRKPSLERFQQILRAGQPIILTDTMRHWPAYCPNHEHHWTIDYWRRVAGDRLVPIEIGSRYTDESWGQELMVINQFIDRFITSSAQSNRGKPVGYLAQHQLFLQIPELAEDVHTPDYCLINGLSECSESTVDSNIWFGPNGTVSPLHHDSDRANLLCQIIGYKYVILYPASETRFLYPHDEPMLCNTSLVDVENPDFSLFADLIKARGFRGILAPGEMLFIPPRCWHYVRALTVSFSVNFWWSVSTDMIPSWSV